jgi:hypothetical protein
MNQAAPSTEVIFRKHMASAIDRLEAALKIIDPFALPGVGVAGALITVVTRHLIVPGAGRRAPVCLAGMTGGTWETECATRWVAEVSP